MSVIRITKTITLPKYRSRKVHHMQTDRMPILLGLTEGTSMAVYRHGNRGYSHSRLRCFPFPLIVPHLFVIRVLLSCDSHSHAWSPLMPRNAAASAMPCRAQQSVCAQHQTGSQVGARRHVTLGTAVHALYPTQQYTRHCTNRQSHCSPARLINASAYRPLSAFKTQAL